MISYNVLRAINRKIVYKIIVLKNLIKKPFFLQIDKKKIGSIREVGAMSLIIEVDKQDRKEFLLI